MNTDIALYDLSALIVEDNPFKGQRANEYKALFRQYRTNNSNEFTFVDINDSVHSHHVIHNSYSQSLSDASSFDDLDREIQIVVKSFFTKNSELNFDEKTLAWSTVLPYPTIEEPIIEENQSLANANIANANDVSGGGIGVNDLQHEPTQQIDLLDLSFPASSLDFSNVNLERTSYDSASNKAISWNDVADICFNIAKAKHVNLTAKNVDLERIEKDRKTQLIEQIHKYLNISALSILNRSDLSQMSIQSLEELKSRCESKYETLKTSEALISAINVGSMITSSVFPNGIPLPKGRRLRMKSIKDSLVQTLFSSNTVTGSAFLLTLDKHNIRISNGLLIATKIGEILLDNIEVVGPDERSTAVVEEVEESDHNEDNNDVGEYADMELRE